MNKNTTVFPISRKISRRKTIIFTSLIQGTPKLIGLFSLLVVISLGFGSLFLTVNFSNLTYAEQPLYSWKYPLLSMLILIPTMVLWYFFSSKLHLRATLQELSLNLFISTLLLGLLWLSISTTSPRADQLTSSVIAEQLSSRSLDSNMLDYMSMYPFQSGYILFLYTSGQLFGFGNWIPIRVFNIICCAVISIVLLRMTNHFFHNPKANLLVSLLSVTFSPLIFFSSFVYANIPCFAFCLLAVLAQQHATGEKKFSKSCAYGIASGLFLFIAVAFKPNALIFFISIELVWIFFLLRSKLKRNFLYALISVFAFMLGSFLPGVAFQSIAKVSLRDPLPRSAWIAMGLDESPLAPGWNSGISINLYQANGKDTAATDEAAKQHIRQRLDKFSSDPRYAVDFFSKKIVTQWENPTFQTLWTSFASDNPQEVMVPDSKLKASFMRGKAHKLSILWSDILQSTVYISAAFFFIKARKSLRIDQIIFALTFLGGFAYSIISEGKADYVLPYFVLLLPYAAIGLTHMHRKAPCSQTLIL